jgi:hypothetical protein
MLEGDIVRKAGTPRRWPLLRKLSSALSFRDDLYIKRK